MVPFEKLGSPLHFVGIGGVGMSSVALAIAAAPGPARSGFQVQGSDLRESAAVERLRSAGLTVFIGQSPENVEGAGAVVRSTAVKDDNPEVVYARDHGIPVLHRSDVLAELMRWRHSIGVAGTHGKTSTTALIGTLLHRGGLAPTIINGGVMGEFGSNAQLGDGEWVVAESDESDRSLVRLSPSIAVVTNIDRDHMDNYDDMDHLAATFKRFLQNLPFYGLAVVCEDDERARIVAASSDRRVLTYGFAESAQVRAVNVVADTDGTSFDVVFSADGFVWPGLRLPMPGVHYVQNAACAVAIARTLGISETSVREGLATFAGVERRFTVVDIIGDVTVVDDYGHHPTEIRATLKAALQHKGDGGRIVAVVQPHRFSRLNDLFEDFARCWDIADSVLVCDVFAAGEEPIAGANRDRLVDRIREVGHKDAVATTRDSLADDVGARVSGKTVVLCIGPGSITVWARELAVKLKARSAE